MTTDLIIRVNVRTTRAMSACLGLTQGDLESECNSPFLSSVFSIIFFFPVDLRLTRVCVVIATTRYWCRRSLFFNILLHHRLLWCTGDIVKKIPITLYHRLIFLANEMTLSRRSLYFVVLLSTINRWRTRCVDQQQQQQQSVASASLATPQQRVRNTTALIITPTFRSASTFRLLG